MSSVIRSFGLAIVQAVLAITQHELDVGLRLTCAGLSGLFAAFGFMELLAWLTEREERARVEKRKAATSKPQDSE